MLVVVFYSVTMLLLSCHCSATYIIAMQVAAMQADNVYRPTEDTTGWHKQLLTALADAALQRAKSVMQHTSALQHTSVAGQSYCWFCIFWP